MLYSERFRPIGIRRLSFTLVEMLVAMALIMFVLSILASAFSVVGKTFSELKAIGDMNEKLRTASRILRADLSAYHFDNHRKLSDLDFWKIGALKWQGFFRVWNQGTGGGATPPGGSTIEGNDSDSLPSYITTGHALHFAVMLPGLLFGKPAPPLQAQQPSDVLRALIGDPNASTQGSSGFLAGTLTPPGGGPPFYYYDARFQTNATNSAKPFIYTSQWAEVAYFLRPLPGAELADNKTPLYGLYRRQKLAIPSACSITAPTVPSGYDDSMSAFTNQCNTPEQLTVPRRRFDMNANYYPNGVAGGINVYETMQDQAAPGTLITDDLLVNDVISFDVRLLAWEIYNGAPQPPQVGDVNADFLDLFDNGLSMTPPAAPADPPVKWFFNAYAADYLTNVPTDRYFNDAGLPRVFDTWSDLDDTAASGENFETAWNAATTPPTPIATNHLRIPLYQRTDANGVVRTLSIRAVQVVIRVWDFKTQKTRQVTIVQDL